MIVPTQPTSAVMRIDPHRQLIITLHCLNHALLAFCIMFRALVHILVLPGIIHFINTYMLPHRSLSLSKCLKLGYKYINSQ